MTARRFWAGLLIAFTLVCGGIVGSHLVSEPQSIMASDGYKPGGG
jgi:hypothetical protein